MQYSTPLRLISTSLFQPSSSMSAQLRFGTLMPALDQKVDAAVSVQDLLGGVVDVGGLADVERDRLGLAAAFGDLRHHRIQRILRRPDTTTVQPSAASASAPASPMPLPPPVTQATRFPLFDMQTVSVAL